MVQRARLLPFLLLSSIAACGGDDDGAGAADAAHVAIDAAPGIDAINADAAPPSAFDCVGADLPTTADDPVAVSGVTVTLQLAALGPIAGVSLSAFENITEDPLAGPVVSNADGEFTLSAATGGTPVDAYVKATLDGYLDSYLFPPTAVATDLAGGTVPIFTQEHLETLSGFSQVFLEDGTGHIVVALLDCEGQPVPGASLIAPEGVVIYLADSGFPDSTRTTTSSLGIAIVFNVPPGAITIGATRGEVQLRYNDVVVHDTAVTATIVGP